MKTRKFLQDCQAAAALIGETIDASLTWEEESRKNYAYEDDGTLHVQKRGFHVCIDIGQHRSVREQNERMTKVLAYLGLTAFSEKCLHSKEEVEAEEAKEQDDYCI